MNCQTFNDFQASIAHGIEAGLRAEQQASSAPDDFMYDLFADTLAHDVIRLRKQLNTHIATCRLCLRTGFAPKP
jgi:hypothetical protein